MKRLIAVLAIVAGGVVSAQSSRDVVKFQLSQPAMVGEVELPAGTCTAGSLNSGNGNTALVFRCESGAHAVVLANPITAAPFEGTKPAGVVLTLRGDVQRIDQVWLGSNGSGYQIIHSHAE